MALGYESADRSTSFASPFDCAAGALGVIDPEFDAVRIAEIELGEITMKVAFEAVLVDARHPALENRE
jgi:hypothetical protein